MSTTPEPLPRCEWDFSRVTDNAERVACCWWEYARESNVIREAVQLYYEGGEREEHLESYSDEKTGKLVELKKNVTVKYEPYTDDSGPVSELTPTHELDVLLFYNTPVYPSPKVFPQPWQSLPVKYRKQLAEEVFCRPDPIRVCNDLSTAKVLYEHAQRQAQSAPVARKKTKRGKKGASTLPDPLPISVRWVRGKVSLILDLQLGLYGKEDLLKAFDKFLRTQPGLGKEWHTGKGHSWHSYATALRNLGMMRLNHHTPWSRLRCVHPKAYEFYRDSYRDWYGAPKKAAKFFRELFLSPYCPAMEFDWPRSFHPKWKRVLPTSYFTPDGKRIESFLPPQWKD